MVLGGRVNKSLVSLIQLAGGQALGLSGKDGGMLKARQVQTTCQSTQQGTARRVLRHGRSPLSPWAV